MAYTTGTAATFAAMRTALTDACVADGWTWDAGNEVIHKGTIFARLTLVSGDYGDGLALLGRTSLTAGDGPNYTQIGPALRIPLVFPVTYHVFTFTNEVMLVISSGDEYQWMTFGQSQQPGLPGSGNFYSASFAESIVAAIYINIYNGENSPALFWSTSNTYDFNRNYYLDSGLDGGGWWMGSGTGGSSPVGINYIYNIMQTQPNAYNQESVLMPVRAFKPRSDTKFSPTMEMENVRHIRIDNYQNESIITLGLDKWMVFPYFKRNTSERDGGANIKHTGTFGMAIRYEGP